MVAGDQIWRQVKQGPHREHFPALWRALPFVLPPIPPQRSRSFPGLTMRSQVLQSAIFSCIMQTAYRFVGVELRFRHPASRKHGGRHVYRRGHPTIRETPGTLSGPRGSFFGGIRTVWGRSGARRRTSGGRRFDAPPPGRTGAARPPLGPGGMR